jgi:hypothetical protein
MKPNHDYGLETVYSGARYQIIIAPSNQRWVVIIRDYEQTVEKRYVPTQARAYALANALIPLCRNSEE